MKKTKQPKNRKGDVIEVEVYFMPGFKLIAVIVKDIYQAADNIWIAEVIFPNYLTDVWEVEWNGKAWEVFDGFASSYTNDDLVFPIGKRVNPQPEAFKKIKKAIKK